MSNSPAQRPPRQRPPDQPPPGQPPPGQSSSDGPSPRPAPPRHDKFWNSVQVTRSWTGFLVVLVGAAAITGVTLWGLVKANDSSNPSAIVSILSSAFTAIATTITAYFGIKAVTNTAQSAVDNPPGAGPTGGNPTGGNSPDDNPE